jgi:formylglycine-generating enzyme required for sulfatase activity
VRRTLPLVAPAALAALIAIVVVAPARAFMRPGVALAGRSDMVFVPGATFKLGKQAQWGGPKAGTAAFGDPEGVVVSTGSFFIDRTEVTVRAYAACVTAGACDKLEDGTPQNVCTSGRPDFDEHPINCVTFDEATKFCAWQGKRLPSEAEFELAERGPNARPFPWGDTPPEPKHVNACDASCVREEQKLGSNFTSLWQDTGGDDGWPFTAPVGNYPDGASPFGALDLSGNVEEWVSDPWGALTPGAVPMPGPVVDHVVRGGSWDLSTIDAFAATRRSAAGKDMRAAWLGFRCARDGA